MEIRLTEDGRYAYEVLAQDCARLVRCYGEERTWHVPETIEGYRIVEAAAYVFSAGMWQEPFEESERTAGPPACGSAVEEVYFPKTLKKIGRYAFYNCDHLRVLGLPGTCTDIGGGSFNGSRQYIKELHIDDKSGEKSCLKELLSELSEQMRVYYSLDGVFLGVLLFPYYYEEAIENTPARILEKETHGVGHRYRYCFQNTQFVFREYDAERLFYDLQVKERPQTVLELALWRLRWPHDCRQDAVERYESYVRSHLTETVEFLLERTEAKEAQVRGDLFRWFVRYPTWNREDFDMILEALNRWGRPLEMSLFMEEKGKRFPAKRRSFTF